MPSAPDPGVSTPPAPPPLASLLGDGRVALFLDFDGTLVELAPGPDAISPLADMGKRLELLSARLGGACAVVSGRAISDIERHIGALAIPAAGSHGSDIRFPDGARHGNSAQGLPAAIEASLRSFADEHDLDYEHKPHGGALHYRRNPEHGSKAVAFAQDLAQQHGWAAQSGKCVVELVANDANKGSAVETLMAVAPFAGAVPFFIGDDLTDEAGFRACQDAGGAGILVGDRQGSCAQYAITDVAGVHQWLEL